MEYTFTKFEKKWQAYWQEHKVFASSDDYSKPKYYCLDMFPYPSGAGLHVGHPEGYTATDIICRYKRAKGFNVLHPMGWDAFGLPAEQYAIQTGTHPSITTKENCDNFRRQIQSLGLSYDWDAEINTTDPKYFKWTQWIFIRLYNTYFDNTLQKGRPIEELEIPETVKSQGDAAVREYIDSKRLAYYDNAQVWWCNTCKTVCANEEVLNDGSHEKCGTKEVERRFLKQWMLRIPHYAERLIEGLENLDWSDGVKDMQRNWIGRSTGAEVDFAIEGQESKLTVYTTRPDTLFGATFMVIAPEHAVLQDITTDDKRAEVEAYVQTAALKSDLDRTELAKEKTGVFTGSYAINPLSGEKIQIWVADYVLMGYGTGAIMAVPAHDSRDFEFAKTFDIPVNCILDPGTDVENREAILAGESAWTEDGIYINSSNPELGLDINGLTKEEGIETVVAWLEDQKLGKATVNFKLRDWLFSRQRYWGEPFPIIHWEDGEITCVEDDNLPVELPKTDKYLPSETGESPLANCEDWLEVVDENGRKGRRETNTMPQWAGSCWYYLRYIDPKNDEAPFDKVKENYWMPVDLYVGGAEHAVLHLLYSRFWHKVLFDLGVVSTDEPYQKLYNQGMILAFAYETASGSKVTSDLVREEDGKFFHTETGDELNQIVAKMSKSLKNVVNPDDIVEQYGADSLRLYEMFMGPLDQTKPWAEKGVKGVYNFLRKVHTFFANPENIVDGDEQKETLKVLNQTIKKVGEDIEGLKFNTGISQMMIFTNHCIKAKKVTKETAKTFAQVLAPYAPHLAEELWEMYGGTLSVGQHAWPEVNQSALVEDSFQYPVSFNGKMRFKLEMPMDASKDDVEKAAMAHEQAQKWLDGKQVVKVIVVPKKIVNIVVK